MTKSLKHSSIKKMNGLLLGALVLFIGFSSFLGVVVIFPSVEELSKCYKNVQVDLSNYKMRENVLEWTVEQKCMEEKKIVDSMNTCFENVNQRVAALFLVSWADKLAKYLSKVDFDRNDFTLKHKQACAYYEENF